MYVSPAPDVDEYWCTVKVPKATPVVVYPVDTLLATKTPFFQYHDLLPPVDDEFDASTNILQVVHAS